MRPPAPFLRSRKQLPGFTLLELVATLIILGGLVIALMEVKRSTVQARRSVDSTLRVIDEAQGAMDIIIRDMEAMHTYDSRAYLMVETLPFSKTQGTSIAFPTSTPVRISEPLRERPGLVEIAYLVDENPDGTGSLRLFRRELEVEPDPNATTIRLVGEGLVLFAEGLQEFHMEFLSAEEAERAQEGQVPQWTEEWESGFGQDKLPVAIRVTLTVMAPEEGGAPMTMKRTVRLPINDPAKETLQPLLETTLNPES